jgi:uncharacterized membrane protein YcaP (DUF421 family)
MALFSTVATYVSLVVFTRLGGIRSLSKLSSVDFAHTVAIGSMTASIILMKDPPLLLGTVVLGAMFCAQWVIGRLRRRLPWLMHRMDNTPIMLMKGERILDENLDKANVSRSELMAKLRQANVRAFSQVDAVVMETTGDVSVLADTSKAAELEATILEGVRRPDRERVA